MFPAHPASHNTYALTSVRCARLVFHICVVIEPPPLSHALASAPNTSLVWTRRAQQSLLMGRQGSSGCSQPHRCSGQDGSVAIFIWGVL